MISLRETTNRINPENITTTRRRAAKQPLRRRSQARHHHGATGNLRIDQALAGIAGGLLPIVTYSVKHTEVHSLTDPLMGIVVCGLAYSAPTIARWARSWTGSAPKAWSFTLLLEASMVFSGQTWIGLTALALLCSINAAYAVRLVSASK